MKHQLLAYASGRGAYGTGANNQTNRMAISVTHANSMVSYQKYYSGPCKINTLFVTCTFILFNTLCIFTLQTNTKANSSQAGVAGREMNIDSQIHLLLPHRLVLSA